MAGFSLPVVYAFAVEVVMQVDTLASVLTGVSTALIHINITEAALPAIWAETLEGVDPINASASIFTGG